MIRLSSDDKLRLMQTAWCASSEDCHSMRLYRRGLARIAVNYGDGTVLWISTDAGFNALRDFLEKRSAGHVWPNTS